MTSSRAWWHVRRRLVVGGCACAAAIAAACEGRGALVRMSFFRVRTVEVRGTRYLSPRSVVAHIGLDSLASVWQDLDALEARLADHPRVAAVHITRRLPGALIVQLTENVPLALAPSPTGFRAYDAAGRRLPVDPRGVPADAPIIARRDPTVLRVLGMIRDSTPALYARLSAVQRAGRGELVLHLASLPVRAMTDVSADRLAQLFPVEADLVRRQAHVREIDLRFRDQVIARLQ